MSGPGSHYMLWLWCSLSGPRGGGSLVMLLEWPRHDSAGRRVKCLFGRPTKGLSKLIEVLKVTQIPLNIPKKGLEEGERGRGGGFSKWSFCLCHSPISPK